MVPLLTAKLPPRVGTATVKDTDTVLTKPQLSMVLPQLSRATMLGPRVLKVMLGHPDMENLTIPSLPRTTTTSPTLAKSMLRTANGLISTMMPLKMLNMITTMMLPEEATADLPTRPPLTRPPPTRPPPTRPLLTLGMIEDYDPLCTTFKKRLESKLFKFLTTQNLPFY